MKRLFLFFMFTALLIPAYSADYAWLAWGPNGLVARAINKTVNQIPQITLDGEKHAMKLRTSNGPSNFPIWVYEYNLPNSASTVSIDNQKLNKPKKLDKIVILGDTGCRIKSDWAQNCNGQGTGEVWGFPQIAKAVEGEHADLLIHVGDYVYRESPCPVDQQPGCKGSPYGYQWSTWEADFFTPGKSLLSSTPWIFTRGNHENCDRAWRGYFYFIDPLPLTVTDWNNCPMNPDPFVVDLGAQQVAVIDTANVDESQTGVDTYAKQFNMINGFAKKKTTWTATHRPFWAIDSYNQTVLDSTLSQAINSSSEGKLDSNIEMALAGHIHLFEHIGFTDGKPTQIVSGGGGTSLDPAMPSDFSSILASINADPNQFYSFANYSYLVAERKGSGWSLTVMGQNGKVLKRFDASTNKNKVKAKH